ncbi:MAG: hypothetical protein Q9169_002326 [Polycauliona sp. 2 TL-2023]
MRRSSMRRGSAVLLSILPLLAPTYALPMNMGGNEAVVAHLNIERAAAAEAGILDTPEVDEAVPVPAHGSSTSALFGNTASEGPEHWLPVKRQEKRQEASSDSFTSEDVSEAASGIVTASGLRSQNSPSRAPPQTIPGPSYGSALGNIASYGPSMRLGTAKRELEERKADPIVTLDFDYVPPVIHNLASNQPTGP